MSNLMNYLPCLKCNSSSNIIRIDYYDKEDSLYLKLSCVRNCSENYIKYSELYQSLKNQKKIPMSILVYGNYSKEKNKIENFFEKIINYYNKIYTDLENIETNFMNLKKEIKDELTKIKNLFESLQIINELIFGAYLKNIEDNLDKDNISYLKNNLKCININNTNNFNIQNNLYVKEIEKDISKINSSITFLKKEFSLLIKSNPYTPINLFPKKYLDNIILKPRHNSIETHPTNIKDIQNIILLSDENLALGSDVQLVIYNLSINKEIDYIPGNFTDIREIKYNKKYKPNNDHNSIIILSILETSIKIYNIKQKKLLLNYVQNSSIDNVLELYNGEILYVTDFSIYNMSLNKEFKIYLSFFCFSMINLFDKQNILGYTYQKHVKFIYLDNPKKLYKKITVIDSEEIFDMKQIYDESKNYNLLIILSTICLHLYDLNKDIFFFVEDLNKTNIYKKINIDFNGEIYYIVGENSIKLFKYKNKTLKNFQNISNLKTIKTALFNKIMTTPFCFNNNGKYILIFESNEDGFNTL